MTSLPLAFFKGCTSANTDPNSPTSPSMVHDANGNNNGKKSGGSERWNVARTHGMFQTLLYVAFYLASCNILSI